MNSQEDISRIIESQIPFFMELHGKGDLAPIYATMDMDGKILGGALVGDDASAELTLEDALNEILGIMDEKHDRGELRAWAMFTHGARLGFSIEVAQDVEESNCFLIFVEHLSEEGYMGIVPYRPDSNGKWEYAALTLVPNPLMVIGQVDSEN